MKKTSIKKRILTIVISVLAIIATICTSTFAVNAVATKRYWSTSEKGNLTFEWENYEEYLNMLNQAYAENDEMLLKDIKNAKPISENQKNTINQLNEYIIKYFKEVENIDVTQRLSKLEVKTFTPKMDGTYGFYNNLEFDNTVYMSEAILNKESFNYMEGLLEIVYIHETIHYLGFCEKNSNNLIYIYEGLTEALTQKVCEYSSIPYFEASSYSTNKMVSNELMKVYPEIVTEIILAEGEYDLAKKINNSNEDYASQLENLLKMNLNKANKIEIDYSIQYIVYEILKVTGTTETSFNICKGFGILWLING